MSMKVSAGRKARSLAKRPAPRPVRSIRTRAVVSEKGQVTIPKVLRDRLGIIPGQALDFAEDHGKLVARKILNEDPFEKYYGILGEGRSTDDIMKELRGEPDAV